MTRRSSPRHPTLSYQGTYRFSWTICTHARRHVFITADVVSPILSHFLQAGGDEDIAILAYCFMPDHLHLLIEGRSEQSSAVTFISRGKQKSGYWFKQRQGVRRLGTGRLLLASDSVDADLYQIDVTSIDGETFRMDRFRGQAMLIVNVASECGYTPQYAGLESVYRKYKDQGLVVLGFPCNQFGGQEPGTDDAIADFCRSAYNVTFPMFHKIDVNGEHAHPLFRLLKARQKGILGTEAIKWNFTKFLVDRSGEVVARYGSSDTPEKIADQIAKTL